MSGEGVEQRCCIPSCANHRIEADDAEASDTRRFFAVPSIGADDSVASDNGLRRALWLRRIKKCTSDFDPDTALLCDRHFVEGQPARLEETSKLDWLPNQELDNADELCEDVEDFVLEEEDEDDEEELDEEFIRHNKRQKEKVERLKRENVALKRKIQEMNQTDIIQGMRLKMLKTMKVDGADDEKQPPKEFESVMIKCEKPQFNEEEENSKVNVPVKQEPMVEDDHPKTEEKAAPAKLQINSLKMKLSNILGTIK